MHCALSGASRCPCGSLHCAGRFRPSRVSGALLRALFGCLSVPRCRRGTRSLVCVFGRRVQHWQPLRALLRLRRLCLRARPSLRMARHVHRAGQPRFLCRVPRSICLQSPFATTRASPHKPPVDSRDSCLRRVYHAFALPCCDCAS